MSTCDTVAARARVKARDINKNLISDANLLLLVNGSILPKIHSQLRNIESNLVYAATTLTVVASTMEYTSPVTAHEGFFAVWPDGEDWFLTQVSEEDKTQFNYSTDTSEPKHFYLTEDNKVGLLPVPADADTLNLLYWKPLTELTAITGTLPWYGIWDIVIQKMIEIEIKEIDERDVSADYAMLNILWDQALNATYNRGVRNRMITGSDFFSIEGI